MTLVALLSPVAKANTGRLKFIAGDPIGGGTLAGRVEPVGHFGWLLCNGFVLSNSGRDAALFAMLSTRFGSNGQLPNILDGRVPIPKGASSFPTVGAAAGEINHVITLAEYPNHNMTSRDNLGGPRSNSLDGYINIDGFPGETQSDSGVGKTSSSFGGGGSHPNMSPYAVSGYVLVKL